MNGTKTQRTSKELKAWEKEKKLIPVMIKKYCHGKHGTKGEELCEECKALTEYALFRLEKCPFKVNKKFWLLLSCPLLQARYAGEDKGRDEVVGAENDIHASRVHIQTRFSDGKLQTQITKRGKGESKCLIKNS